MSYPGLSNFPFPCPYGSDGSKLFFFNPLQIIYYCDDFLPSNMNGVLNWNQNASGGSISPATGVNSGHPGVLQFASGTNGFNNCYYALGKNFIVGGGRIVIGFVVKYSQVGTSGADFGTQFGLMDSFQGDVNSNPGNGIYFNYRYSTDSGDWTCNTNTSGTKTTSDSGIPADTNWHHFIIDINAAGTSVDFWIDNTKVITTTTNIPSVALAPAFNISANANLTNSTVDYDAAYIYQFLTTSR